MAMRTRARRGAQARAAWYRVALVSAIALPGCQEAAPAPVEAMADAATEDSDGSIESGANDAAEAGPDALVDAAEASDGGTADMVGCANALDLTTLGAAKGEASAAEGKAAYYKFRASAGEFFRVAAELDVFMYGVENRDPGLTVSLLSADGSTLLATSHEGGAPTYGYHRSSLAYRGVQDGTWCVRVAPRSRGMLLPGEGDPTQRFTVVAQSYGDVEGTYDLDTEPNDDDASAQRLRNPTQDPLYTSDQVVQLEILGTFGTATDVDVYRLRIPPAMQATYVYFVPNGPGGVGQPGSGSTAALGTLEMTEPDGKTLTRSDPAGRTTWLVEWYAPGEDVLLWVRRDSESPSGANDFYRILLFISGGWKLYETETAAGGSDSMSTAESSEPLTSSAGVDYVLFGTLHPTAPGTPIDIDYWTLPSIGGSHLGLRCYSARYGSGVMQANFAVLDPEGNLLREGVETFDQDVEWSYGPRAVAEPLVLPVTGTYYLRVSAAGQRADVASRRYECYLWSLMP